MPYMYENALYCLKCGKVKQHYILSVGVCVCVIAYASFGLSIITPGDIPHMTNEQDLGALRRAHLSQDGR